MSALELLEKTSLRHKSTSIDLDEYLIDVAKVIEKEISVSSVNDVALFTLGNLSTITGKAKSRKTFFASAIAASIISGECLGIRSERQGVILYLDTEQSDSHVQTVAKRILRLSSLSPNENSPNLIVYALRALSTEERVEVLKAAMDRHKPMFVVIDGIRDLLHDFNNIAESSNLVSLLMKLSTEHHCHLVCILHQNKADTNMRGHAGTELLNKSETVLEVSTTNDITAVKAVASRGLSPNEIYFQISTSGLPFCCNAPDKEETKTDQIQSAMIRCLGQSSLLHDKLKQEYMEAVGCSEKTARRHIVEMLNNNLLNKDEQGYYRIQSRTKGDDIGDLPY